MDKNHLAKIETVMQIAISNQMKEIETWDRSAPNGMFELSSISCAAGNVNNEPFVKVSATLKIRFYRHYNVAKEIEKLNRPLI